MTRTGLLVLRLGDMATELSPLDPLAKSVLRYLRLLIADDAVHSVHARTSDELKHFMAVGGASMSHIVLVGHGSTTGRKSVGGRWLPVADFVQLVSAAGEGLTLVLLACGTGFSGVGQSVTGPPTFTEFVGPLGEVQGAAASFVRAVSLTRPPPERSRVPYGRASCRQSHRGSPLPSLA